MQKTRGKRKHHLPAVPRTLVHSAAWVLLQSQTFLVSSFSSSISWWTLGAVILLWELHLTPFSGDGAGELGTKVGQGSGCQVCAVCRVPLPVVH